MKKEYTPLEKPDIVYVAERFTHLRKAGKWYSGLCPMHKEKSPSFFVNPERQYYRCFSCGAYGDVIDLAMRVNGLGFKDALTYLGIQQPRTKARSLNPKQRTDLLLTELKGMELEILFHEVLRLHSDLLSDWMRIYHRLLGLEYGFWLDDPYLAREHIPDVMKRCRNSQDAQRLVWYIEHAIRWREELSAIHGGSFDERLAIYRKITEATK